MIIKGYWKDLCGDVIVLCLECGYHKNWYLYLKLHRTKLAHTYSHAQINECMTRKLNKIGQIIPTSISWL